MDLQCARIAALCEQLKLARLSSDWQALAQAAACEDASYFLEKVLASEQLAREERKRTALTRLARMPSIKTLEQFDWAQAGGASKAQIVELGHLTFVERAENVVMLGPSGVGKTHIAPALCQRAVMAGHKARFITAADLMMQLAAVKAQNRLKDYFNRAVLGPKLLVVDEIGYLPFGREPAQGCWAATGFALRSLAARWKTPGGSDLLRRFKGKWVKFKSALTADVVYLIFRLRGSDHP
ncbi:ATP-binding protein [Xanthomonas albilineans]|uniref:ATP-binding protein n=1 Tax=Xanthomonas albilineans TaxID=29447 RepID=UPI000B15313B|nr:ATP-binding protein [Xanthomonas albilineans]